MKRKILAVLMAGCMTVSMTGPVWAEEAAAETEPAAEETAGESLAGAISSLFGEGGALSGVFEEGGAVESLFGEGGALSSIVPEGVDVDKISGMLSEQLSDPNSELYQTAEGVISKVTSDDGKLDTDALEELAGELISGFTGGEDDDMAVLDEELADYDAVTAAVEEYVKSRNAEYMEVGDLQTVARTIAHQVTREDGTKQQLGYYLQENFALDGTDYKLVSGSGDTLLLTLAKKDDGTFEVTDAKAAEDGEGYTESIEAMCAEIGITVDDYFAGTAVVSDLIELGELIKVLNEHPEAERIEYAGEMLTREDLEARSDEVVNEYVAMLDEGADAAGEEAAEEGAVG